MNSFGLQTNADFGPTHTSIAALIVDLVRRLSRPSPSSHLQQPSLSTATGSWWNDTAPHLGNQVFRGPVVRAFTTLLEQSIVSEINQPADIPNGVIEDQLAAAILQLRTTFRRFDDALRVESLTQAVLDRPGDAEPVYAAFPTTEMHLEVMRRTGWSPRQTLDGRGTADQAAGVPAFPIANDTLRSVLFVLALLAQPSPLPTHAASDIIPATATATAMATMEPSHSQASSVFLASGGFSSLSGITSDHTTSLQTAISDVTGVLDHSDLVRNPSLRLATRGDPWRIVFSESSMHVPSSPLPSALDQQWDANALNQLPPIGSGLGGPTRVHELVQPSNEQAAWAASRNSMQANAGLFAPALDTRLSVPALDESSRFSVLDWLPSVPGNAEVPPGPRLSSSGPSSWLPSSLPSFLSTSQPPPARSTAGRSTAGSSQAPSGPSWDLSATSTLRPWAGLDSTETWELANPNRSLSMIPQPDRAAGNQSPLLPKDNDFSKDPWLRAGQFLDPSAHTRAPLLSWDTSIPRGALTSNTPAALPAPPISVFSPGSADLTSPFLSEASPDVHIALMDRAILSPPNPFDLISESTLVLHIYQLVCGIESYTFRWLGMPSLMQIATNTADPQAPLRFGYARGRMAPPRVTGLSPGAVRSFMPRFFAIGSGLRRLELAAVDLRTRIRSVGFTGCALAHVLDEVVSAVRSAVIEWRKQPGGLRLRNCWTRMAQLEAYVVRLCMALGSTETRLYKVEMHGLALVSHMAMVAFASDADGYLGESEIKFPKWQLLAFLGTLRPTLRWLYQWLTGRDAWQSGLLWDTTDPHREFPVVWVDRGPTEDNPHLPFWSTGFQVRADYVKAPLEASGVLPPAFLARLMETHKVSNSLCSVRQGGSERGLAAPNALFAWTADLAWPTTFDTMHELLAKRDAYARRVLDHLVSCAKHIAEADEATTRVKQSLHKQSNQSRKRHIIEWAAQRRAEKEQSAARKRALMAELRALSELRAKMAMEERAKEAFVEAQRIKAHLQSAERWGRLVEREKARLLGEYEEKVQKAKKEAERLEWRRKRLELGEERGKVGMIGSETLREADAMDVDRPIAQGSLAADGAVQGIQVSQDQAELVPLPPSATERDQSTASPPVFPLEPMEVNHGPGIQAPSPEATTDSEKEARNESMDPLALEPVHYEWSTFSPSGLISFTSDPSNWNPHTALPTAAAAAADDSPTDKPTPLTGDPDTSRIHSAPTTSTSANFSHGSSAVMPTSSTVSQISFAMANSTFFNCLTSNLALSEYALLASVLSQPDLLDQLAKLPQVFCLRNAGVRHSLLQVLFPNALGSGPSPDIEFGLARVLDGMPGFGISAILPHDISTDPYDPHLYDFLSVTYTPPAPLWILITPDVITIYNTLLRFLVRIQYLDHATKSLFRSVRNLWKLPIPPAQYPSTIADTLDAIKQSMAAIDHLLGRFQTEVQHTTNALWSYASDVAIGETWDAFEQQVDRTRFGVTHAANATSSSADLLERIGGGDDQGSIRSVKQLHNAHLHMVESMHFRCLLRRAQRPIQEAVNAQIRAVLTVEHVTREYVELREKYLRVQFRQATTGDAGSDGGLSRPRTVRFVGQIAPGIDGLQDRLADVLGKVQENAKTFRTYNRRIVSVLKSVEERSAGTGYTVVKQGSGKHGGSAIASSGLSDLLVKLDFNGFFGGKADVGIVNRL